MALRFRIPLKLLLLYENADRGILRAVFILLRPGFVAVPFQQRDVASPVELIVGHKTKDDEGAT